MPCMGPNREISLCETLDAKGHVESRPYIEMSDGEWPVAQWLVAHAPRDYKSPFNGALEWTQRRERSQNQHSYGVLGNAREDAEEVQDQ